MYFNQEMNHLHYQTQRHQRTFMPVSKIKIRTLKLMHLSFCVRFFVKAWHFHFAEFCYTQNTSQSFVAIRKIKSHFVACLGNAMGSF